jgi:hypothetical protein
VCVNATHRNTENKWAIKRTTINGTKIKNFRKIFNPPGVVKTPAVIAQ